MPLENTIPFPNPNSRGPRSQALALFREGNVVEASTLLSGAILQGESADLWNDWAVVQLSVAERAFRRALLLAPTHYDATSNLGILLFSIGNRAAAAGLLRQALTTTTGAAHAYVNSLLALCEIQPAPLAAPPHRKSPRAASSPPTGSPPTSRVSGNICNRCKAPPAPFWKSAASKDAPPPGSSKISPPRRTRTCSASTATTSHSSGATSRKAGGEKRAEFRRGVSRETLRTLPFASYDFIYIDGGHGATDVLEDAVLSFRLAKPGAVIAFDDYLWNDPQHNKTASPSPP